MSGIPPAPITLRRCGELEYILLGDLRELLEEPLDQQNRRWISAVLDTLLETLPTEHRLKCVNGYMSEVLDEFPNWSGQVEALEAEHYTLYEKLADLRNDLNNPSRQSSSANTVRRGLTDWMKAFQTHRENETALLQTAINLEVGGGD